MSSPSNNYIIFLLDYISEFESLIENLKENKISKDEFLANVQELQKTFY